jgi:hypothetical protein|uniref:Uncharacterized protein n=1 Tax=Inoviridae sp. ctPjN3 TaxID=2826761 RepID=A0A8S5NHM1_9VIRU|nr:MAG TPA: hypothetical protein [Inoviridae sp. ctPjN3]
MDKLETVFFVGLMAALFLMSVFAVFGIFGL